jgi:hypothetical protein
MKSFGLEELEKAGTGRWSFKVESINPYTSTLNISPNAATKWFTNVSKPRSDSYSSEATMDVLSVFIRVALDFIGLYGTQSTIIRPSGKYW